MAATESSALVADDWDEDRFFEAIAQLVMLHSPSGVEDEINQYLLTRLSAMGVQHWQDEADNIIIYLPSESSEASESPEPSAQLSSDHRPSLAITAHKDEIGGIVKRVEADGRLSVRALGGAYPWVYGEGVVDVLGSNATISGVLSFGSRHVSHESPQKVQQQGKAVDWADAWIETKCSAEALAKAGVRPGTRMVVGKHRKQPFRLGAYVASYTLDNKASVAILMALAETIKSPPVDVYLVASAKEEVGAVGALFFTQRAKIDRLIALEICPLSQEYPIVGSSAPALFSQDSYGLYDEGLNREIVAAAERCDIAVQQAVISGFGSDASIAMKFGHVARGACLAFPTENTHGYEIAHLKAICHCYQILKAVILSA